MTGSPGALARPAAGVSALRDMSTIESDPYKYRGEAADRLAQLDRPYTLGTDADGAVHHHSPFDDEVVVVAPEGTIQYVIDVADRTLAAWIAYVQEQRGAWQNLNYRDSYGEILKEGLQS